MLLADDKRGTWQEWHAVLYWLLRHANHKGCIHLAELGWELAERLLAADGGVRCPMCNRTFATPRHLKHHFSRVHYASPMQCPVCGRTFASHSRLAIHCMRQAEELMGGARTYPVVCPECGEWGTIQRHRTPSGRYTYIITHAQGVRRFSPRHPRHGEIEGLYRRIKLARRE